MYRHYGKPVIHRVPKSSPCANHRAHGEESLCRGPNTEHTAKIKHTAKAGFAVCSNLSTRRTISLPCAKDRHTAKIAPRGPTFTAGQRRHILPCASVRHTANRPLCRVPYGGTRQTQRHVARRSRPVDAVIFCRVPPLVTRRIDLFVVCHMEAHGKH